LNRYAKAWYLGRAAVDRDGSSPLLMRCLLYFIKSILGDSAGRVVPIHAIILFCTLVDALAVQ